MKFEQLTLFVRGIFYGTNLTINVLLIIEILYIFSELYNLNCVLKIKRQTLEMPRYRTNHKF